MRAIDPRYATNITVYHANEHRFGAIPLNMDTGDSVGDLYFAMREIQLPIQCAHEPESEDCANVEASGNDLVVTKLTLEVRKPFGKCTSSAFAPSEAR